MRDDDYVDGDDVDDVDDDDDGDDVDDVDHHDDDDDDDGVLQGTPSLKGQFVPHALPMSPAGSDKDQRPDCQSHHLDDKLRNMPLGLANVVGLMAPKDTQCKFYLSHEDLVRLLILQSLKRTGNPSFESMT